MVTEDGRRWPAGIYGLPQRTGKLKDLTKFDAEFFGIHPKLADVMDPQLRILLEGTYEALIDAGINPNDMRGSKTGVFVGVSSSASYDYWIREVQHVNAYALLGCTKSMFSNRISFAFDFKGPSFTMDTACSSSLLAFHQAVKSIRSGECNAAIVGGVNLILDPKESLLFHGLNMLSPDGTCKSFDISANGYVRSEACVVILLQKGKDAKRVYATVLNTGTNTDGYKEQGITYPSGNDQQQLMLDVYKSAGLELSDVSYLEAHGTGTRVGDPEEINTVAETFCKQRKNPLLIGSVKSNMGHSEPASGLSSLAKVIIAMETGIIPANLHYKSPNLDIPPLSDGRMKVVDKNLKWDGGIAAVSSFGFGGANVHVVLKSNPKTKLLPGKDKVPKLVAVSGRNHEAVDAFLTILERKPRDDDLITLIHDIHKKNIARHPCRGYTILGNKIKTREISEEPHKNQVWYIFTGMGCQWPGMGRAFMCLDPFAKSIHKSAALMKNKGIDVLDLIYNGDETAFENILHSFVLITTIQVALVDLLAKLGISPDGMIGHSAGELGCAYADGTFTAEQAVLVAYWRGRSILDAKLQPAAMIAVGLSAEEVKTRLPPSCYLACYNSTDSVTIAVSDDDCGKIIEDLKRDGIRVTKVKTSGVASHSKYIADAEPILRENLQKVIPVPKTRSKKWISSSVPESRWSSELALYSSAEYHVNNLLSPVLFYQALQHIPEGAIVIEIAPHSLLQSILKREVPKSCMNIGLLKKEVSDELSYFLANVGKLYLAGLNPNLSVFHQPTSYPVAKGTPMLNSMIKWNHEITWTAATFNDRSLAKASECVMEINTTNETDSYILGHTIDERVIFPGTGYLTLVWKTFAKLHNQTYENFPVIIEDIHFIRATIIPQKGSVRFLINVFVGSGDFEICEGNDVVVRGKIHKSDGIEKDGLTLTRPKPDTKHLPLDKEDIYKELRLRGYDYSGLFRGIKSSDNCAVLGALEWHGNWVTFIDTMLQFSLIGMNSRELVLPSGILRIVIDPSTHLNMVAHEQGVTEVQYQKNIGTIKSGGIEVRGIKANLTTKRQQVRLNHILEQYCFVPNLIKKVITLENALSVVLEIVLENSSERKVKVAEITTKHTKHLLSGKIMNILESQSQKNVNLTIVSSNVDKYSDVVEELGGKTKEIDIDKVPYVDDCNLSAGVCLFNEKYLINIVSSVKENGFILTLENKNINKNCLHQFGLSIISEIATENASLFLLRKLTQFVVPKVIKITHLTFYWIEEVKAALKESLASGHKYLLVSEDDPISGILGFFNCLKQEPGGENFRCVFSDKKSTFSVKDHLQQLKKDLLVNVMKNGKWGSYRHLKVCEEESVHDVEEAYINILARGNLSSLKWIQSPLSLSKPEHNLTKEMCTVYYASLNFRDVLLASGTLSQEALSSSISRKECVLGFEFAGRNSKGNRVMSILEACGLATSVLADPSFLWDIPAEWTMEQAATIPVVYATGYYALIVRGRLKKGESVLIHSGSGGVGQAAIAIALNMGCIVFTTVGTQQKREFLTQRFAQLKAARIGNSRDTSFEQMILEETSGRGVDVVLNSLAEDKLQASVRCLAKHGRFLEIGKLDLSKNTALGTSVLLKNTTIHGVLLDSLLESGCENEEKMEVVRLMKEGINSGVVKPLPTTTFSHQQVERAFRFMAAGKHIGKVLLKIRDEENEKCLKNIPPNLVPAVARTYFNPEKSYIIVGGLGGFGLELAHWFLTRGAKSIILVSRSGVTNGYQSLCLRRWKEQGFNVVVSLINPITLDGAKKLLNDANVLAPVGGIFNLAAVLKDAILENQTVENFEIVCNAKVSTTQSLDKVSRMLCPQLDYFVVFSSVCCGRGNPGQTNYGYANSVMERICEIRQTDSLPGMAIQWGAIGDVGSFMKMVKGNNKVEVAGTVPQRISSCLSTMDILLKQSYSVVSSFVLAENVKKQDGNKISLVDVVKDVLGLGDLKSINTTTTLIDIGLDSLMASEIKQSLERNYSIILSDAEIRSLTFGKLMEIDASQVNKQESKLVQKMKLQEVTLIPKETLVKMNDGDKERGMLFIVNPIEGVVSGLMEMASYLDCTVWGLQCTSEAPLASIEKMAAFYVQVIRKIQSLGPYNLCGYSYGATVAFEMALQLENNKETCNLNLIDGSPGQLLSVIEFYKKRAQNINDVIEESVGLSYFISLFTGTGNYHKIIEDLKALPDQTSRLKLCVERLKSIINAKEEDISAAALATYKKLLAADNYRPVDIIQGYVILFKAENRFAEMEKDYGLSKQCKQPVKIYEFQENHQTIIKGKSAKYLATVISEGIQ